VQSAQIVEGELERRTKLQKKKKKKDGAGGIMGVQIHGGLMAI
jgi:hypothetical protein